MTRRILTVFAALGLALCAALMASGPASAAITSTAAAAVSAQAPCPYADNDEIHPQIQEGDRSELVRHARCLLREIWGYPVPDTSFFDTSFKAHIMHFQTQKGLNPDGIIGVRTWRALHP